VTHELGQREECPVGVGVAWSAQQFLWIVVHSGCHDAFGQITVGPRHGAEGRVESACGDRGRGGRDVGIAEGHDIEFDIGVGRVEVAQQPRGRDATADHIDAQRAASRAHRGFGAFSGADHGAGVRKERLPVDGELHAPRGPGEQPDSELLLQDADAFGDRLLSDRQVDRGEGELSRLLRGEEGPDSVDIHPPDHRDTTIGWNTPPLPLFDPALAG
jgi:hypothetical protein